MPAAYLPGDKVATSVLTRCGPQKRSGSRSDQRACRRSPRSSNRSMGRDAFKMRSDGASPNGRELARQHSAPLGRETASGAKRGHSLKRASADALPSQRPLPRVFHTGRNPCKAYSRPGWIPQPSFIVRYPPSRARHIGRWCVAMRAAEAFHPRSASARIHLGIAVVLRGAGSALLTLDVAWAGTRSFRITVCDVGNTAWSIEEARRDQR